MKQYESYKDSGAQWIGQIPSHWEDSRLKYVGNYINGYAFKPTDWNVDGLPIIRIQDLTGTNSCPNYYDGKLSDKYLINDGDILVSWAATIATFKWNRGSAWLNQHIFKALPRTSIDYDYFYWLLNIATKNMKNGEEHGIMMEHVTTDLFGNFPIPLPPLAEQTAIAEYLDKKCGYIDSVIATQERRIALLEELKQSTITEAVTRGLNPDATFSESGVDWIGKIPSHWEVRRIKTLSRVKRGASPRPIEDPKYFDENGRYSWVRIADVTASDKYLTKTDQTLSTLGSSLSVKRHPGDIFISIAGTVGKPIITKIDCCIHDGFVWFPNLKFSSELLYYIFKSGRPYLGLGKMGTQLNLNTETIGNIRIPVPPESEQQQIVDLVEAMLRPIDSAISKARREIELLQELKQTTITEAVTGKVKVC